MKVWFNIFNELFYFVENGVLVCTDKTDLSQAHKSAWSSPEQIEEFIALNEPFFIEV